jgi:translation initiation factor 2 subunit 1
MVKTQEFPTDNELVIGRVREVKNFGVFVALEEYPGKEGLIPVKEVAHGWVKYIRDYVREGNIVVCKVLRVSIERGHIDLSLKAVNDHQKRERIQEWKNEQRAEKLIEIVSQVMKKELEECYTEFGYDLINKYGGLYQAFEEAAIDEETLKNDGFKGKWFKPLVKVAQDNITLPLVTIRGVISVTVPGGQGVIKIKNALVKSLATDPKNRVSIHYLGAPKYRIEVTALDYKTAEELMEAATKVALKETSSAGGEASFKREEK